MLADRATIDMGQPRLSVVQDTAESDSDVVKALTGVVIRTVRCLGDSGRPEEASQLAATAWVATRRRHPVQAQRINGIMHYLAGLDPAASPPSTDGPHDTVTPAEEEDDMADQDATLDVRSEIPARRHELIFETYGALDKGEGFVLVNDHDPKPLYYQFAAEHPDQFSWDYLEQGPETWRVRIGRTA